MTKVALSRRRAVLTVFTALLALLGLTGVPTAQRAFAQIVIPCVDSGSNICATASPGAADLTSATNFLETWRGKTPPNFSGVVTVATPPTCTQGSATVVDVVNTAEAISSTYYGCYGVDPPISVPVWFTKPIASSTGASGSILPKYQVVGVYYAPPGNINGSHSSVTYGSSFVSGTTTNNASSWKVASAVTVSGVVDIFATGSATAATSWSEQQTSTNSITLTTTTGESYSVQGPLTVDGLDHDEDIIWVWLNPAVQVAAFSAQIVTTGMAYNSADPDQMDVIPLTVAELKLLAAGTSPASIPALVGSAGRLDRLWDTATGPLNTTDYTRILQADPFATNPALNPASAGGRFDPVGVTINYVPSDGTGSPVGTTYNTSYNTTSAAGQSALDTYMVGYSTSGGANFFGIVGATFATSTSYTYTNMWTQTNTTGNNQTAQVVIYGPLVKDGYTGPSAFTVWKDNVYGTFVFYGPPD